MGRDYDGNMDSASDEVISIHAPRMGRDTYGGEAVSAQKISIHAPRMGRDAVGDIPKTLPNPFQSTRPVWGATDVQIIQLPEQVISIHAPRMGRDRSRPKLAEI